MTYISNRTPTLLNISFCNNKNNKYVILLIWDKTSSIPIYLKIKPAMKNVFHASPIPSLHAIDPMFDFKKLLAQKKKKFKNSNHVWNLNSFFKMFFLLLSNFLFNFIFFQPNISSPHTTHIFENLFPLLHAHPQNHTFIFIL